MAQSRAIALSACGGQWRRHALYPVPGRQWRNACAKNATLEVDASQRQGHTRMTDERILLELGASVPVFRSPGPLFTIEPPGRFVGAVLRTEAGYESWRYPPASKNGQPIATSATLAAAVDCFALRKPVERPPPGWLRRALEGK